MGPEIGMSQSASNKLEGALVMNGTNGGPHILLLERDQQLMALLSSELGLAGYEGHSARTAVGVFGAIARFPVRVVMVSLGQAKAGRRGIWSALYAQRRGPSRTSF